MKKKSVLVFILLVQFFVTFSLFGEEQKTVVKTETTGEEVLKNSEKKVEAFSISYSFLNIMKTSHKNFYLMNILSLEHRLTMNHAFEFQYYDTGEVERLHCRLLNYNYIEPLDNLELFFSVGLGDGYAEDKTNDQHSFVVSSSIGLTVPVNDFFALQIRPEVKYFSHFFKEKKNELLFGGGFFLKWKINL